MAALEHPQLKPWYRLSLDEGRAVLRYAGSVLEFEGAAAARLLPHLLPLLDGTRAVDEVVAELGEPARPAVEHALALLRERDLLTEAAPADAPAAVRRTAELLAATDAGGRGAPELHDRLAGAGAGVLGGGPVAAEAARLLRGGGVGRVRELSWDDRPSPELVLAAPSDAELTLLPEWNRRALAAGTPWLQVLPFDGQLAAVGPLFVPGQSACHECYRRRRAASVSPLPPQPAGHHAGAGALDAVLAGLAALAALRWLVLGDTLDAGVLLAVELTPALRCTRHVVYRVPRCPACSPAAERAAASPWSGERDVAA